MLKREFTSNSLDQSRIDDLENKYDSLSRDMAGLEIEIANMQARMNATSTWFENRVDLIYRRVCLELQAYLGAAHLDSVQEIEIDTQLNKLISGGLAGDLNSRAMLKDVLAGELRPGVMNGPLTLRGFRLHRQFAREAGEHIVIRGGANAIVVYGPYKKLKPGHYRLKAVFSMPLEPSLLEGARPGTIELDIYCSSLDKVVARQRNIEPAGQGERSVDVEFEWTSEAAQGTAEFRVHQYGDHAIHLVGFELELRDRLPSTEAVRTDIPSHAF